MNCNFLIRQFAAVGLVVLLHAAAAAEESPRTVMPVNPLPRHALDYGQMSPAPASPVCRAGERQCTIGSYIVWCCRADQQCNNSYAGGCR